MPDGLVVALRPLAAASPFVAAWRTLGRRALIENLFYEADFALAASGAFGAGIGFLLVCDRPPEEPGLRLLALWPCRRVHRWGLPLAALMGWTHGFSVFGPPLVDRDDPARGLRALLRAPRRLGLPPRLLMPYLPLDGVFARLLDDALAGEGCRRADFWPHERGLLDLAGQDAEARKAYLAARLSDGKARQLARLSRRLEAAGPLEHRITREPARLADALDDYIALEAAGWKGRAGTAVGRNPAEAAFLHRLVEAYGASGRVRIDSLRRTDRSLASSLGIETESTFWYLKIAHDEAEARNSPGFQLVHRVTRSLLADAGIATADSCAPPNFPLAETFWGERRRLAHGLVEAAGGDRWFSLAERLEGMRAQASRLRTRVASRARSSGPAGRAPSDRA